MDSLDFIAFDLETTGLDAAQDRIIEIGAVKFLNGSVDSVFATLIDPERAIPAASTAVNKISNDMVVEKPKIQDLLESFANFCEDLLIVAHNAPFDFQFLQESVTRHQSIAPKGVVIDTLPIARRVFPGLPNYKLGTLASHCKILNETFHRAEEDAECCGKIFMAAVHQIVGCAQMPPIDNLVSLTGKKELRFVTPASSLQPSLF